MNILTRKHKSMVIILLAALLALWGCPKKTEVSSAPEGQAQSQKEAKNESEQTTEKNQPTQPAVQQAEPSQETAKTSTEGLRPIYFDFDKSFVRDDARNVMKANAAWLKTHPRVKIEIEGNCDERGTKEYNQALGQRRAASAKKYLTDMGVSGRRISLISYGKEKPVCAENTENCLQKNRRDDFEVRE